MPPARTGALPEHSYRKGREKTKYRAMKQKYRAVNG